MKYCNKCVMPDTRPDTEFVCLELDPDFICVGKAVIPQATWVEGSLLDADLIASLGQFDEVICNPPYAKFEGNGRPYNANLLQYAACQVALQVAPSAVFILLQSDCPFKHSFCQSFERVNNERYKRFAMESGLKFEPSNFTTDEDEGFRETKVKVEIVHVVKEGAV